MRKKKFHFVLQPRGFALVATLLVTVLLVLLIMGLLTLSALSLRQSSQRLELDKAQANARLALSLAIGDLQKYAGPDQRITASAAILDEKPETEDIDDVGEPHVVGVWQSTLQEEGKTPTIPNYDKPSAFRRWMVSGLSESNAANPDALDKSPFRGTNDGVRLVGKNTSKDNAPKSLSHLWAGKLPVPATGYRSGTGGHCAYAVMDEGVKARLDVAPPHSMAATERSRAAAGAPQRIPIDILQESRPGHGAALDAYFPERAKMQKAITLASAPLLNNGLPDLAPYFHDLTTDSLGVLADVTRGGLRKDLSLFGELATLPGGFLKRRMYSDSDTPFAAITAAPGYLGGSPDPYWSHIYDHLNIHKRLSTGSGNTLPSHSISTSLPSGYRAGSGMGDTFTINRDAQPRLPLAPVIVRCELMFSLFAKEIKGHSPWEWEVPDAYGGGEEGKKWAHMLHMIYTPIITLWNPYNVTLKLRQPVVEIANPPVAFRFIRQKSSAAATVGEITNRLVPLDEMYVYGEYKFDKKFVMQLFGQVNSAGVTSGDVVLLPGEVKVFSPAMDPNWDFSKVFDFQNSLTDRSGYVVQIKAAPGWRGPQYGYNIDWLTGETSYINSSRNGTVFNVGVIGSRADDVWDIECGLALPKKKDRSTINRYAVSLLTTTGATSPASQTNVLSRLEFDYHSDLDILTKALTPSGSAAAKIPFKMSDYSNPEKAENVYVSMSDPMKNWIVKPFMILATQAKTTTDATFPSKTWIHNDATRPLSYQSLRDDHQAWNSHELALIQYKNGMATDAKIDSNNRGYAFGGSSPLFGSSFYIHRELALTPVQSVAQLSQFDLAASAFPGAVDHPVGSSFASPVVKPGELQTGKAVDHAWLANYRLWDSWYASTFTNQRAYWPVSVPLQKVIDEFANIKTPLPNARYQPWAGEVATSAISDLLTKSAMVPEDDAFRKAAAVQLLNGAFNINSTSKAAWMAVLAGLDRETITSLLFDGATTTLNPNGFTSTGPYFTRRRMPAESTSSANLPNPGRFEFWNGGCELTRDELEALAAGIVREVKLRGPFLSLAEFVNRRVGPESNLTLKGAIQAAIDNAPDIGDLNTNAQGSRKNPIAELSRNLTEIEANNAPYAYPMAATGQSAIGAGGMLDQLAVLNQIGPHISARSDTFRIRAYGDTVDATGKLRSRAWCEAIVQRVPDYLVGKMAGGNDAWDAPTNTMHPDNLFFGRRFEIRSFRWLAEDEI